ncbi:DUF885 family protein [uncultured Lutibacter sp.]|uniref:DUF885 family protein n=1 Tax=uncultured Lutibacter sp. TaxID=437739 RepID=UPI0026078326|nr:DUF885 family protein [uncultured Lutibacter sp.]
MKLKPILIFLYITQLSVAQNSFNQLQKLFVKEYTALEIPNLQINYVQNLNSIKNKMDIEKQEKFFLKIKKNLKQVPFQNLTEYEKLDYQIMKYETVLNLERIALEKQWDTSIKLDDNKSIYTIKNGKKWYAYLLKRWVNANVNPDDIFQFGLREIEFVKTQMTQLQKKSGHHKINFDKFLKDSSFFYFKVSDIQKAFEKTKLLVNKKADTLFPYINKVQDVKIKKGNNPSLTQVPAYYNNGTFFYNYFDKPFNKRQIDWIYIHEAIPGHHYQLMINNLIHRTEIQALFWYPGFAEGWGAYVEFLGKELGAYKTIYDEYGKWEWDLIRSVRVALDVGINYYGWSDIKAQNFWKKYIINKDDIGLREIERMKRWPAQVVTYKYGANIFLNKLDKAKKENEFSYKSFHKHLLKYGDIPLELL